MEYTFYRPSLRGVVWFAAAPQERVSECDIARSDVSVNTGHVETFNLGIAEGELGKMTDRRVIRG